MRAERYKFCVSRRYLTLLSDYIRESSISKENRNLEYIVQNSFQLQMIPHDFCLNAKLNISLAT